MGYLISDLSTPPPLFFNFFLGAEPATTPADGSTSASGNTVVIPDIAAAANGQLVIAGVGSLTSNPVATIATGWTRTTASRTSLLEVFSRTINNDIGDHTWTMTQNNVSRAGGLAGFGPTASIGEEVTWNNNKTVPNLTANTNGSSLVVFVACQLETSFSEVGDLKLKAEHNSTGSAAYSVPFNMAVYVEENLSSGVISSRSFETTNPAFSFSCHALIMEKN